MSALLTSAAAIGWLPPSLVSALPLVLFGLGGLLWPATRPEVIRFGAMAAAGRLLSVEDRPGSWVWLASAWSAIAYSRPSRRLVPVVAGVVAWVGRLHLLSLAVVAASVVLHGALSRRVVTRRQRQELTAVAAAVALLTAELAAGSRPELALTAAARSAAQAPEVEAALVAAASAAVVGEDPAAALLAESPGASGLEQLATAWRLSARTGTALVSILERLGSDLQARESRADAVTAAVAGARSSATLLALLPLLGCLLGAGVGAHPWRTLTQTTAGQVLGLIGGLLDVAGLVWTAQLVRRAGKG